MWQQIARVEQTKGKLKSAMEVWQKEYLKKSGTSQKGGEERLAFLLQQHQQSELYCLPQVWFYGWYFGW